MRVVHGIAAIYIQNAIMKRIRQMHAEEGVEGEEMRSGDVMKAAQHIIKYDFGFCFYVFFLPAATFYSCYAISQVGDCKSGNAPAFAALMAMIAYGFATMFYLPCMYCGTCCAASTRKVAKKNKERSGVVRRSTAVCLSSQTNWGVVKYSNALQPIFAARQFPVQFISLKGASGFVRLLIIQDGHMCYYFLPNEFILLYSGPPWLRMHY